jgi:hypothetical protein
VITLPVHVKRGQLTAVLAVSRLDRQGRMLRIKAGRGVYHDFWTDQTVTTGPDGELVLPAEDGIALLWKRS